MREPDPDSPAYVASARLRAAWRGPACAAHERQISIGKPHSGKSILEAVEFAMVGSRRLAIDAKKGAITVDDDGSGVCYADNGPQSIDWSCRTIVYRPKASGAKAVSKEIGKVYAKAMDVGSITIWLDESVGSTTSNSVDDHVRDVLTKGRWRYVRHKALMQRPRHVDPFLLATADHILMFGRGMSGNDIAMVADTIGMEPKQLRHELATLRREKGDYSWLHYDGPTNILHHRHRLPQWMLDTCPVHAK
jgi:hypothetical protein